MSKHHHIGHHASKVIAHNRCEGVALFTCHEWNDKGELVTAHTCEVKVIFDPQTKKWRLEELKQWEGKF